MVAVASTFALRAMVDKYPFAHSLRSELRGTGSWLEYSPLIKNL